MLFGSFFAYARIHAYMHPHQGELHDFIWASADELDDLDPQKYTRLYAKIAIETIAAKQ